jgi:group I intron endonuclease
MNSMTIFPNLQNSIVFTDFLQPGIYMILNKTNNKCYIGESDNVANRLSGHFRCLKRKKSHDCADLQKDWDLQKGENFSFQILFIGPEWSERSIRLQKERELLLALGKEKAYNYTNYIDYRAKRNSVTPSSRRNSIPVIVNGIFYPSVREAAHTNNMTISAARRCLNNPNNTNWSYVNPTKRKHSSLSKMIVIEGVLYPSLNLTCSVLNLSAKTLRKFLRDPEKLDWNYFSDLSESEQKKILDAHPEIRELPRYPEGRPVRVGDVIYPTIVACAKEHNINPTTVQKRIHSRNPRFQDWFWAENTG